MHIMCGCQRTVHEDPWGPQPTLEDDSNSLALNSPHLVLICVKASLLETVDD